MIKEVNFDGLVSPSHNYSGLAIGNVASIKSEGTVSRPRDAALQGLDKMKVLAAKGILQAFLAPQLRPSIPALRKLGFQGSDENVIRTAYDRSPGIFAACSSASSMWTANAATFAPSCDTMDGKSHFTPANLVTNFHRSIEVDDTAATLRSVFSSSQHFIHHDPLPATPAFADEGAANHIRLANRNDPGLHIFVYGSCFTAESFGPKRFPARQTLEACQAVARLHQLPEDRVLFLQQNPDAIDAGVFHNDVISVGHENLFLVHEGAFREQEKAIEQVQTSFPGVLHLILVPESAVTLRQAVATYLFNSQIVTLPDESMLLLCPSECHENKEVRQFIEQQIVGADNPINEVVYQDLHQSMRNGGGPACLRLRVGLNDEQRETLPSRLFFTSETEAFLRDWILRNYPETLTPAELSDFDRYQTNKSALAELTSWIFS